MQLRTAPFLALLAMFAAMVAIGALPGQADALSAQFGDKSLHVAAYAVMGVLANQSISGPRTARALASLIFVASLGLLDESIQSFLPYRNASLIDWCFDIGAAFTASSIFWLRAGAIRKTP